MSDRSPHVQLGTLPLEEPPAVASVATPRPAVSSAVAPHLRLWPAVVIAVLMWVVMYVPGYIPALQGTRVQVNAMLFSAMGGAGLIGLWWLLASRAHWTDRLLVLLFFAASGLAVFKLAHPSFVYLNYGPIIRGLPVATTALVVWLLLTPWVAWPVRRLGMTVAIALAWGYCCLLRLDGVWGDFQAQVSWRWEKTEEERFLADRAARKAATKPVVEEGPALKLQAGDWPSFRGAGRDSRLTGVRIGTDWQAHPPRPLWKHRIGPGWSSFAVVGDRVFTQEQLDKEEAVVCYDANTGEERWSHTDPGRFEETAGGIGPRATPTFADGWLYTLGANGKLNCLDPATGKVRWSRDIVADSGASVPRWGFSSSPLVVKGVVMVFAGGPEGKSVLCYKADTGKLEWTAGEGKDGYSSPHLLHVGGVDQVAIASDQGLTAIDPASGKVLWKHDWTSSEPVPRVAQPAAVGDSDVLLGTQGNGVRRLHVTHETNGWDAQQVWESRAIKPYYNDLVIYKDHLYGFDGNFFTCVSLADGQKTWRERGYGNGQVVLLADQGLLLISTEKGEVVLVEANPEQRKELGRFKAIEGKTWNHPVLAHGKLFIRNGEEMACFQLAEEGGRGGSGK
jgi:outer membrane protein assembly factor BamB